MNTETCISDITNCQHEFTPSRGVPGHDWYVYGLSQRVEFAVSLISKGYWILPTHGVSSPEKGHRCTCGGGRRDRASGRWIPCENPNKHPRQRTVEPLKTELEVREYFSKRPDSNYGILHGVGPNPYWVSLCLDFDTDKNPFGFGQLQELVGPLPYTAVHRSPSGGFHIFFKVRPETFGWFFDGRESRKGISVSMLKSHGIEGVDILYAAGTNGFSIGPLSLSGKVRDGVFQIRPYVSESELTPVAELLELPTQLQDLIQNYLKGRHEQEESAVAQIIVAESPVSIELPDGTKASLRTRKEVASVFVKDQCRGSKGSFVFQGQRSTFLFGKALALSNGFALSPSDAEELLSELNNKKCSPALPSGDVKTFLQRAWRLAHSSDSKEMGFMMFNGPFLEEARNREHQIALARASIEVESEVQKIKRQSQDVFGLLFKKLVNEKSHVTTADLQNFGKKSLENGMKRFKDLVSAWRAQGVVLMKTHSKNSTNYSLSWENIGKAAPLEELRGKNRTKAAFASSKLLDERLTLFIQGLKDNNPAGFKFNSQQLLELLVAWDSSLEGKVNSRGIGRRIKALHLLDSKHTEAGAQYSFNP